MTLLTDTAIPLQARSTPRSVSSGLSMAMAVAVSGQPSSVPFLFSRVLGARLTWTCST